MRRQRVRIRPSVCGSGIGEAGAGVGALDALDSAEAAAVAAEVGSVEVGSAMGWSCLADPGAEGLVPVELGGPGAGLAGPVVAEVLDLVGQGLAVPATGVGI